MIRLYTILIVDLTEYISDCINQNLTVYKKLKKLYC